MMAAPLLIGTDLRTASPETLAIYGNPEIIAIDQDRLGVQAAIVSDQDGLMVLDKPLAGGDRAVALYNSTDYAYADDLAVADSGSVVAGEPARTLTAGLTGATWLRLVTTGSGPAPDGTIISDHTDWAAPVLTCGEVDPAAPVQPTERTLFSFESGTEDWHFVNPEGGAVAQSAGFHTEGDFGLQVTTPVPGNWFGRQLAEPLDLTGMSTLKFDVKAGPAVGTSGEIAIQIGPDSTWCQGGLWAWTNPNSTRTIVEHFDDLECSGGVPLDPSDVRAVYVFLNGLAVHIDNFRAE